MRSIGILKETKQNEKRVILLPKDISLFTPGFEVLVEKGLANSLNIQDEEYIKYGAKVVSKEEVWKSDVILKYKAVTKDEYKYLNENTKIGAIFHAEGNEDLIRELLNKKCTAYTYEFVESNDGYFPMAYPGGEIAGKMAVMYANHFMQSQYGGKGKSLFKIRGASRAKIAVIGYGNVGGAAIRLASILGNEVYVFGTNINKMKKTSVYLDENIHYFESTKENLENILPNMDVIIGAILISTYDTPPLITESMVKKIEKGTVIIDVTCGYGKGYMPFIEKYTTLDNPIYINEDGIIFCKIDNLPSAYPISTTEAYSSNAAPWLYKLVKHALKLEYYEEIENSKIVENGNITNKVIKEHWNYYNGKNNI